MKHCYVSFIVIIMRKNVKKKKIILSKQKTISQTFIFQLGKSKKKSAIISTIYRLEKKRSLPSNSATRLDIKQSNRRNVNRKTARTSATSYLPAKKKVRPRVWSTEEGGGWGNGEAVADADGECQLSALNAFITILGKSRNAIVWPKWLFAPFMDLVVPLLGVYALGKQVKEAKVDCARLFFMPCFASWRFFN